MRGLEVSYKLLVIVAECWDAVWQSKPSVQVHIKQLWAIPLIPIIKEYALVWMSSRPTASSQLKEGALQSGYVLI